MLREGWAKTPCIDGSQAGIYMKLLRKLSQAGNLEGARQSEAPSRSVSDFMFKNKVHHVVINQLALKLESVHQAFLANPVNHAGNPGRFLGDDIQGFHGENLCRAFGVLQM